MKSKFIEVRKNSKRLGFYATENIPNDKFILREKSAAKSTTIYETLYEIFQDKNLEENFKFLLPNDLTDNNYFSYEIIYNDLINLENKEIQDYLLKIDKDILLLYYLKYVRNVYAYNKNSIKIHVLLFHSALFNHSCNPNIAHFPNLEDNELYFNFVTLRDIKKDEELVITYLNDYGEYTKEEKHKILLNQYGFVCDCDKSI